MARRFPAFVSCLVLAGIFLPGCGSTMLLDKEFVKSISAPADAEPHVVYSTDDFTPGPDGKLLEKKYVIIRVGSNPARHPRALSEDETASRKILDIEGRVIHADGSHTRIPPGAFYRANLSDEQIIAEQYARAARIPEKLHAGDLVELVCIIEHTFPRMGIHFSPASLEYSGDNVTCSIETAPGQDIQYQVYNASVQPVVQTTPAGGKKYMFSWPPYHLPSGSAPPMAQRNSWPMLLAAPGEDSWASFGDWYLDLIKERLVPGKALSDTTARIVAGKNGPKEKMDAIFDYCQRSVRYEQMYLENGEFVPNPADVIFQRRFGDCKDYATLMHAMAASAGVPTEIVLCYRGRGRKIFEQVPVSQFNHVILHFSDNGRDRWYDATDRIGLCGAPSFDLANARVLILEKGKSHFATIEELAENLASIGGKLAPAEEGGLSGDLTLTFSNQYAVDFSWVQEHLNAEKMRSFVVRRLKEILNNDLLVDSVFWTASRNAFSVAARCNIPNSLTTLGEKSYVTPSQLFPNLLPDEIKDSEAKQAFYFPYLNRVSIDLSIALASGQLSPVKLEYRLPAGPYDEVSRPAFLAQLSKAHAEYTRPITLKGMTHP
jgi:hypothetical protein